ILKPDVWYKIFTLVNRHEQIFLDRDAVELFNRTLCETGERFPCEVRSLVIQADSVSFYIKPADGLQLPEIMQWLKQTYAVRYNVHDGRTGHIWGDRYQSVIVDGPPEDAEEYVFAPVDWKAGRRQIWRWTLRADPTWGKRLKIAARRQICFDVPPLSPAKRP
ncbi:MAG: transposase, partial [Spirochaetaceae bacterium]|nr:transposase [Spirochaetaceae bacterium]